MQDRDIDVFDFVEITCQTLSVDIILVSDVVHTMDHLQQHRPHIIDERKEHHLEVVGIIGHLLGVKMRYCAETSQHNSHRFAERLLQFLEADVILVVHSVQERGHHRDIAQANLKHGNAGHLNKMEHIGLS